MGSVANLIFGSKSVVLRDERTNGDRRFLSAHIVRKAN